MPPVIAVENHSTVVSDETVAAWADACRRQVSGSSRFARYWGSSAHVTFVAKGATKAPWWQALILDDSDQAGALGYHDTDSPWGGPQLKVFAATDEKYGLLGSVTLSHEIVEAVADPWCNLAWQTSSTRFHAVEVADAVEADQLGYDLPGHGSIPTVRVSDFVLPAWYMPGAPPPFTCVHSQILDGAPGGKGRKPPVAKPLQLAAGGYASIFVSGHGWTQDTAEKADHVEHENRNRFPRRSGGSFRPDDDD